MANQLVVRYYPVDGEFAPAENNRGAFGVGVWVQPGIPPFFDYDYDSPTMVIPSQPFPDGQKVGRFAHDNMTVAFFDTIGLVEGQYVEVAVQPTTPVGALVPLTLASFPLDVYIAGLGPLPIPPADPEYPVWEDTGTNYAGGVVEFGFYDATDTYYSLGAIWVDGGFFTPKFDGSSYDNPTLPPATESQLIFSEDTGLLQITLQSGVAPPAFWTNLRRSVETI